MSAFDFLLDPIRRHLHELEDEEPPQSADAARFTVRPSEPNPNRPTGRDGWPEPREARP